ncbi:MAG: CHAP domain-containing protein, partial [Christensenellaceae bacterium]|nr:CHAP domain-containing protein [Christensenellaceae bacterium]
VALNEGVCEITYKKSNEILKTTIKVSNSTIPLGIRNLTYIGKREFLVNQMSRLPKYNQYAKWYYKKHKEVGWCSVFTSYVTNAAGIDTYKYNTIPIDEINKYSVFGLLEGQVGHQWDGFTSVNRFTNIPQPGYYVIYGNRKNAYRFTHVGLVVDVEKFPDGWYQVTTVEGNMSNTVKKYCFMYNSNIEHPKENMAEVDKEQQINELTQYKLHTDHWCVFGFCATWEPLVEQ